MSDPIRLVFGVHLHQPVGNFGYVFEQHVRDVYRPFLERASAAKFFPLTLHVSGPLLEWLETNDAKLLDTIGRLAADGNVEMLLAGFDEPILASLPKPDRLEQIGRMRNYLGSRFGVTATGLWLTERVWEPDLAADLADAGVGYVLVDDRHFLDAGFEPSQLRRPFRTQHDGRGVSVLAIDERLRYFIPFKPPEWTADHLRALRQDGHGLAVFADDGEKFGGWPGTFDWVYTKGWLDRFMRVIGEQVQQGEVRLVSAGTAVREVIGGGLAYLPTASYREMEAWSLPPNAQRKLTKLENELGEERLKQNEGLVRGGIWRHFLVKYAEANRLHKAMMHVSALCRGAGDPPLARRAVGRAQCNDAYWHGVFGGLYLPHLRHALWRQLAIAEKQLRASQGLVLETLDFDGDGDQEFWIHSPSFSAIVSPMRGGAVELLTHFSSEINLADVLTRRREAYHELVAASEAGLHQLPPEDQDVRAIFVDRVLPGSVGQGDYQRMAFTPLANWARARLQVATRATADQVEIEMTALGFEKRLLFLADGSLRASWWWDKAAYPEGAVFAPELSLSVEAPIVTRPAAEVWRFDITTTGKSERGLEETCQGVSLTPRWPVSLGTASIEVGAPPPAV